MTVNGTGPASEWYAAETPENDLDGTCSRLSAAICRTGSSFLYCHNTHKYFTNKRLELQIQPRFAPKGRRNAMKAEGDCVGVGGGKRIGGHLTNYSYSKKCMK